jgi:hypothetical protein
MAIIMFILNHSIMKITIKGSVIRRKIEFYRNTFIYIVLPINSVLALVKKYFLHNKKTK